jgi:S1-C subfamily serine protease
MLFVSRAVSMQNTLRKSRAWIAVNRRPCSTRCDFSSVRGDASRVLRRAAVSVALLAAGPFAAAFQFNAAVYDEIKPSVIRVTCSDRAGTGFLWSNPDTAVTAWHVVAGCGNITVYFESLKISRPASVTKVLRRADLALLKITNAPTGRVLIVETNQPSLTEPLSTLGYPLQIRSMTNTPLQLRYGGKTLRAIVPDSIAEALSGGSPSLDLEIDSIDGHLLHGHSGAPIFNEQRRIVAIADGGLENGAAEINWGIPAKFLNQLASSSENTNGAQAAAANQNGTHLLFAAETETKNLGEVTCSGLTLTKLRTTTFTQVSKSVDSPVGLFQIVHFFGIDPSNVTFDVYQHLPSGATFVLPEGARLNQDRNGDCVAMASSGGIEMHLQVGVLASAAQARTKAQAFEFAWAVDPQRWFIDPQWTNLMPLSRFDGLSVQRRAYTHISENIPGFRDKYGFETVALRNNVFIGLATKYQWSPQFLQHSNACRLAPATNGCGDVQQFMVNWVKSVLAVQLTTFPVG